jgi:outer membrane protein assembly factor BamB
MRYIKITFSGIKVINDSLILLTDFNRENSYSELRSRKDFRLILTIELDTGEYPVSFLDDEVIFYNYKNSSYVVFDIRTCEKIRFDQNDVLEYRWNDAELYLEKSVGYKTILDGQKVYSFVPENDISYLWIKNGIIEFFKNKKQNNWLKCIEPSTGNEKWRLDFKWHIVRCEAYQHLLILDYNHYELRTDKGYEDQMNWENPIKYTIAINAETGDEEWRHNFRYNTIDYENGLVLSGGHTAKSVDMATGKLIRDVTIIPEDLYGYRLRFSDEEGFYYIHHRGSFGKISKTSGNVLWEFDLLDEQGAKRKLTDWLLLGNGKLVLSTLPNHPNGDFTCIFDPEENMEYSNIIDGKRVKPLE